jgi:signal transduction histidine kinase
LNTESHFSRKEINLVDEFENVLRTYDNYVIGKINITKEFPSKLIFFGNTESISQVWKNIFFNSIQAMYHAEKNIYLSIQEVETIPEYLMSYVTSLSKEDIAIKTKEKNWALVSITDSGEGIPQNLQKKIFTPFFTTKPLGEGIGLGLYTCKKIVHEHGGVLFFKSETGNTDFVVALPLKSIN